MLCEATRSYNYFSHLAMKFDVFGVFACLPLTSDSHIYKIIVYAHRYHLKGSKSDDVRRCITCMSLILQEEIIR